MIDRWQDLVFTVCYRMVDDYCEAQDLTQETFLAAWRALDRFDGANEKAWLCRIAANKCTDALRRRRLRLVQDGEEALPFVPDPAPDPERRVLEAEVHESLHAACLALKEPYRSTALAYFVEERSFQEIARATGENLKTVQTRVYRAKAQLQKSLGRGRSE
ncbi:MAG: sigma-70 family RNA polymerase sigma factor [Oscillospiraceae bacterium]|nr:sigma-70 family RNA polymerase sigma factor [Oscillospiraceae bacterium]